MPPRENDQIGTIYISDGEDYMPFVEHTEMKLTDVEDFIDSQEIFRNISESVTFELATRLGRFSRGMLDVLVGWHDTNAARRYIRHVKRMKEKERRKKLKDANRTD